MSSVRIETAAPLFYAALFGVPETRALFLDTVGDRTWSIEAPEALVELLSTEERLMLDEAFQTWTESLPPEDLSTISARIGRWVVAYEQLRLCSRLSSLEELTDAIFAQPATHDSAVSRLSRDRLESQEGFAAIGSSLSTAEISEVHYAVLERLSAFDRQALITYFRDLYQTLAS